MRRNLAAKLLPVLMASALMAGCGSSQTTAAETTTVSESDILSWFESNAERYDNMRTLKAKIEKAIFEKLSLPIFEDKRCLKVVE